MSTQHENLRHALAKLHDETFDASMERIRPVAVTNEDIWRGQEDALRDAAEAIYAQALRDVLVEIHGQGTAVYFVRSYATRMGIDLTEATQEPQP